MFQAGLKVYSFVYCVVILAALSDANIMSELEFSTLAVTDRIYPYDFETDRHVDIVGCVRECRAHNTCKFINYNTRMNLCTLNHFYTHTLESTAIIVRKEKAQGNACWLRPSEFRVRKGRYAYHASNLNTCNPGTTCEVQYCDFKRPIGSFEHYGNMYAIGNKQAYGCLNHSTNTMYKQIDVCEPNGEWSLKGTPCSYTDIVEVDNGQMIYYISDVRVSQSEAAKRCEKENAHLLKVTRVDKIDALKANLGSGGRFANLWIDAHTAEGVIWRTFDGQEIDNSVLELKSHFGVTENHHCATTNDEWQLLPTDCASINGYICETAV